MFLNIIMLLNICISMSTYQDYTVCLVLYRYNQHDECMQIHAP